MGTARCGEWDPGVHGVEDPVDRLVAPGSENGGPEYLMRLGVSDRNHESLRFPPLDRALPPTTTRCSGNVSSARIDVLVKVARRSIAGRFGTSARPPTLMKICFAMRSSPTCTSRRE